MFFPVLNTRAIWLDYRCKCCSEFHCVAACYILLQQTVNVTYSFECEGARHNHGVHQYTCFSCQCDAVCCRLLQCVAMEYVIDVGILSTQFLNIRDCNTLQHTATHCNTLHHTAPHCTTLQHTVTHCTTLHQTAPHCNTLHHNATHCDTLQHTATHCNTLHHTAPHCTTL